MKKKGIFVLYAVIGIIMVFFVALKWDAIFQRGNPIPYLISAIKLSDENTFVAVENIEDTYITRQGDKQDLFRMIEKAYQVDYKDQLGSSYLFSDGERNYMVDLEIYWGRFTVWTCPFDEGNMLQ